MKHVCIFLNSELIGRKDVSNDYILVKNKEHNKGIVNEYFCEKTIKKPLFNGSEVIESITQQEIDEREALILEQQNEIDVLRQLEKAKDLATKIFIFVRKHQGLTDNQKNVLKGLARDLMQGDVEQAIADFNSITRPVNAGKMQDVYDRLKIEFDNL